MTVGSFLHTKRLCFQYTVREITHIMSEMPDDGSHPPSGVNDGTKSDIYRTFTQLSPVEHIALLYSSHGERLDVSLSFVQHGLENDERCLYISNEVSRAEIVDGLAALGGHPEDALAADQLQILPADDIYTHGGVDTDGMVSTLVGMVEAGSREEYDGLRVTCERPWQTRDEISFEDVVDSERECDRKTPEIEFTTLCQYDLRALDDSETLELIRTHSKLAYRRQVCENPFYRESRRPTQRDGLGLSAEQVLQTTYRLSNARAAIERREQRVSVLNRVLRHNLRNEMNVIRSHAELVDAASDDTEVGESAAAIIETTGRLMDIAEDAKRIEKSVSGSTPDRVPVDLRHAVDRAAERARNTHQDVALTCTIDDGTWVEGSEELEFALSELFETLARTADDGSQVVVGLEEDCGANAKLCLVTRCAGSTLPQAEIQALVAGEETQLSHGNGLGLWLVSWIVELSGGSLAVCDTEDGQEVRIELVTA